MSVQHKIVDGLSGAHRVRAEKTVRAKLMTTTAIEQGQVIEHKAAVLSYQLVVM